MSVYNNDTQRGNRENGLLRDLNIVYYYLLVYRASSLQSNSFGLRDANTAIRVVRLSFNREPFETKMLEF